MKNPKDFVASLARGIDIIRSFTAPPGNEHPGAPTPVGPTDALTLSQVAVRAGQLTLEGSMLPKEIILIG